MAVGFPNTLKGLLGEDDVFLSAIPRHYTAYSSTDVFAPEPTFQNARLSAPQLSVQYFRVKRFSSGAAMLEIVWNTRFLNPSKTVLHLGYRLPDKNKNDDHC